MEYGWRLRGCRRPGTGGRQPGCGLWLDREPSFCGARRHPEVEIPPRRREQQRRHDISDAITILGFLFIGDPPFLPCKESADVNNLDGIDLSDGVYLLEWLFVGGPAPVDPGPTIFLCGFDPDAPGSPGDLGCETYNHCKLRG